MRKEKWINLGRIELVWLAETWSVTANGIMQQYIVVGGQNGYSRFISSRNA